MREKIKALLTQNYPQIDFESSNELVDDGILDSMTLVGIISALSMEFVVSSLPPIPVSQIRISISQRSNQTIPIANRYSKYPSSG